jgi:hypothetical protein
MIANADSGIARARSLSGIGARDEKARMNVSK